MLNVRADVCTTPQILLALLKHEAYRVIADRFTTFDDKEWFEKELTKTIEEECGAVLAKELAAEPYFVDFLRDAPEPTGIKILEVNDVFNHLYVTYDACFIV